jgi:hypothetical protein
MAGFNMADYEPVEVRLARAHADRDDLRIVTDIVMHDDKAVIVKATIYKTGDDLEHARPWATGYAQESIGSSNITRTSWLEVCETSAIGRALANAGYAPKGARASREEMSKATRQAAGQGRGRPAAGQSEARESDGPSPAIKSALEQIKQLVPTLDDQTKAEFVEQFGGTPKQIKDPIAAAAWLHARTEPF